MKILIVEDDPVVRSELSIFLCSHGYECEMIEDFQNVLSQIEEHNPHLLLLDVNLPQNDGYYLCRKIRETSQVPIIIITSRNTDMDELMSMNLGADDFVRKPFHTQILLSRMERLLTRTYSSQSNMVTSKTLILDLAKATVSYKEQLSELSKNELAILHYFLQHQNQIVSREELMMHLWSTNTFVDDNTLSVNISRLRKKLQQIGYEDSIQTKRGMGYLLL